MKLIETIKNKPIELDFGTSGLRGLVKDMTDLECYINAKAFLDYLLDTEDINPGANICIAGDLRDSTTRIMQVMTAAINNTGLKVINCGLIPTPAVALYGLINSSPCIMVTGSHIPADRNGIKFYRSSGEVLKTDEQDIKTFVSKVRKEIYCIEFKDSDFNSTGELKHLPELPTLSKKAERLYIKRFLDVFNSKPLKDKQIVIYEQSSVGRDIMVEIFTKLGAKVIPVERLDYFLPIDTENVTDIEKKRFKKFSKDHPGSFAIVSSDGDGDRPFVIDENGEFYRGDILGLVVAKFLKAKFAAVPISANDSVDIVCAKEGIKLVHTKIGSPYVIAAMDKADNKLDPKVSWEVNGGFLTGTNMSINGKVLSPLPTRDALLPIICALVAASDCNKKVSGIFAELPERYTSSALVNVTDTQAAKYRLASSDNKRMEEIAKKLFKPGQYDLSTLDGFRVVFENRHIVHLRMSGNAPQLRAYTNTDSQESADQLAGSAISKDGLISQLLELL